jgi:two-component system, chemotaxis family, chemotaxis protein CheY
LKHCLVIDDSRVIRKIACRILEQLHFAVAEAEDTTAALAMCRTKMPDAIFLDGQLPQPGGIEFLRSLRRQKGGDHPIVVLCTNENDVPRITEALGAGANDYVMKPFDRGILADKLAHIGLM